jgi:hypothetical protein
LSRLHQEDLQSHRLPLQVFPPSLLRATLNRSISQGINSRVTTTQKSALLSALLRFGPQERRRSCGHRRRGEGEALLAHRARSSADQQHRTARPMPVRRLGFRVPLPVPLALLLRTLESQLILPEGISCRFLLFAIVLVAFVNEKQPWL